MLNPYNKSIPTLRIVISNQTFLFLSFLITIVKFNFTLRLVIRCFNLSVLFFIFCNTEIYHKLVILSRLKWYF